MKKIRKPLVTLMAIAAILVVFSFFPNNSAQAIGSNEAVVSTAAELQSALANGSIDTIYMSNSIAINKSMPIKNDKTRTTASVTIYGYNPYRGDDPKSTRYTLTETSSCSTCGNRIYLSAYAGALKTITLKNLNVYGTDKYGTVYVGATASKTTRLEFIDFSYTGPKLVDNIYGTAYFENADINIRKTYCDATGGVAETSRVYFAGSVNITNDSGGSCGSDLFYANSCTSITVTALKGSNVNVVNNRQVSGCCWDSSVSGFISPNCYGGDSIIIEDGASFKYRGYGIFSDSYVLLNNFTVGKNAYVDIVVDGNIKSCNCYYTKYSGLITAKYITVNEGSTFYVAWKNVACYEREALCATVSAVFNNPKHAIMYSNNGDAINLYEKGSSASIKNAKTINMWIKAPAYSTTLSNPTYSYSNLKNGVYSPISAYFTKGLCNSITVTSSGITNTTGLTLSCRQVVEINGYGFEKYTVTYNANGGQGSVVDSNEYSMGDTVTVLSGSGLTRANYTFAGWNTAADGSGTAYSPGNTFAINGNVTLYAQWTQNKSQAPVINQVIEGADVVTGSGIPGSQIVVTLPDGTKVSATVISDGTWLVNVPSNISLAEGEVVSANQTEVGKTVSDEVYTTVVGDPEVVPGIDVYVENLSTGLDYAVAGDVLLYDVILKNTGSSSSVWQSAYVTFYLNGSVKLQENSIRLNNRTVTSSQYSYDSAANTLTLYVGDIPGGGGTNSSVSISFRVAVNDDIADINQTVMNAVIGSLITRGIIYQW